MEELLKKIKAEFLEFGVDANLRAEKGNKAAGKRSRKSSLVLTKLFKEWRAASIEGE